MDATPAVSKPRKATPKEQIAFLLAEVRALRAENAALRSIQPQHEHPLVKFVREKPQREFALIQEKIDLENRAKLGLPLPATQASTVLASASEPLAPMQLPPLNYGPVKSMILNAFIESPDATAQEIRHALARKGVLDALKVSGSTICKVKKDMKDRGMFPKS